MLTISLSWAVAVDLTPAANRPYVGSSQNNSEICLALGYNGLQRQLGNLVLVAIMLAVVRAETHPGNSNLPLQVTERLLEISNVNSIETDSIILETNQPVMALGGFSGSDPILTTSQLAALVKSGEVRYFLLNSSGNGGPGGSGQSTLISWITQHSKVIFSSQWQSGSTSSASNGFGGSEQLYEITSAS